MLLGISININLKRNAVRTNKKLYSVLTCHQHA